MTDRYHAPGSQGSFQPGSDEQVLTNKVGITTSEDRVELELDLLTPLYEDTLINNRPGGPLTVADLTLCPPSTQ
jgi:cell filamentation protein